MDNKMKGTRRVRTLRNCFFFRMHHWHWLQHVKGQEHSQFGRNASNEKCTIDSLLFRIQYHYNSKKNTWPWHLTFDLDFCPWPWPWCMTLRLIYYCIDALKNKNCKTNKCLTSRDAKTVYRYIGDNIPISISSKNMMRPTRTFYDFRFQSYGSKGDFPFVPLHDWCKFWSDMFINSGDIAHWNMEKLPMLYNGNIRCHGNVCYVYRFPFFINQPYHIDNIQNSENF